jgi:hypothetical protein
MDCVFFVLYRSKQRTVGNWRRGDCDVHVVPPEVYPALFAPIRYVCSSALTMTTTRRVRIIKLILTRLLFPPEKAWSRTARERSRRRKGAAVRVASGWATRDLVDQCLFSFPMTRTPSYMMYRLFMLLAGSGLPKVTRPFITFIGRPRRRYPR